DGRAGNCVHDFEMGGAKRADVVQRQTVGESQRGDSRQRLIGLPQAFEDQQAVVLAGAFETDRRVVAQLGFDHAIGDQRRNDDGHDGAQAEQRKGASCDTRAQPAEARARHSHQKSSARPTKPPSRAQMMSSRLAFAVSGAFESPSAPMLYRSNSLFSGCRLWSLRIMALMPGMFELKFRNW